jgi:hypothetical protein
MAEAEGDVLLFLDDDVIPVEGLIDRHLEIHQRDPMAVVIGPMVAPRNLPMAPWLRWEAAMVDKQYAAMVAGEYEPTPRQFYTANASLRRSHALAAGGFNVTFTRAEDVEFAFRLGACGLRFYFEPRAEVLHEPDRSFASWLRVPYEYGRHDVRMARECGLPWLIELAHAEFKDRHVLNRLLPRACVGSPTRMRLVTALFGSVIRGGGSALPHRLSMALCSALFGLHYWQGLADALGAGPRVWNTREAPPTYTARKEQVA